MRSRVSQAGTCCAERGGRVRSETVRVWSIVALPIEGAAHRAGDLPEVVGYTFDYTFAGVFEGISQVLL